MQPSAQFASPQSAFDRGLGAYRAGRQEVAVSALSAAVAAGDPSARFFAEFYLARIYSETGPATDHAKAFVLFRKLADENVDVDPETSQRAPFVAKALIALAAYLRDGLKEIDLAPNPRRAIDYLHHAAVFFGDKDAQFELAKTYLGADGQKDENVDDVRRGLHYLSVLTEESHAPAQAVLADLFWRGRHVKKDDRRALALATMAVENAPAHERIWIEAGYATIFCAAPQTLRAEAGDLVARWRKSFLRPVAGLGDRADLANVEFLPERQCASGERVALVAPIKANLTTTAPAAGFVPVPQAGLTPVPQAGLKGPVPPVGFRAAGILEAAAKK